MAEGFEEWQGTVTIEVQIAVRAARSEHVEPDEVAAFEHMGDPYFRASWGGNVVGLLLDDDTDWEELAELLTDSYCIQAPTTLAEQVPRPG